MLVGVLPKIGVLWGVLVRVSMKDNNRKSTFTSTFQSTPILESTDGEKLKYHPFGFGGPPLSIKHPQDNFSLQNAKWRPPK